MDTGLYHGVAAMRTNEKRLDTIASNLANVGANGFKRQASVARAFEIGRGDRKHTEIGTQVSTDFTQGTIARTGNPLDLALEGEGFFALDTPNGRVYTRDGSLHLDDKGVLQSVEGFPVAWEGKPAPIEAVGDAVTVEASGVVRQGERTIGKLRVVDFDAPAKLELDGHGHWRAPNAMPERASVANVHQGAIERANVDALDELVAMITAQRSFESSTTLMRTIDQTYKRLNQPR